VTDLRLDHLYRETTKWDASVAWWMALGFSMVEQWGEEPHRAGKLQRDEASVVLAEVDPSTQPAGSVFLATSDIEAVATRAGVEVVDTHWGTRMVSVTDPDGRTYNFEPSNQVAEQ